MKTRLKLILKRQLKIEGMQECYLDVQVPMEDVVETKNEKTKVVQRKKFPRLCACEDVYE